MYGQNLDVRAFDLETAIDPTHADILRAAWLGEGMAAPSRIAEALIGARMRAERLIFDPLRIGPGASGLLEQTFTWLIEDLADTDSCGVWCATAYALAPLKRAAQVERAAAAYREAALQAFEAVLSRMADCGELHPDADTEALAAQLVGVVQRVSLMTREPRSLNDAALYARLSLASLG